MCRGRGAFVGGSVCYFLLCQKEQIVQSEQVSLNYMQCFPNSVKDFSNDLYFVKVNVFFE